MNFSRGINVKDVIYSRLVDTSPIMQTPQKLDLDLKSILNVPEIENVPKSSISDSKLAVDYYIDHDNESFQQNASPQSLTKVTEKSRPASPHFKAAECVNESDSYHSLSATSNSEEKLKQEVKNIFIRNYNKK